MPYSSKKSFLLSKKSLIYKALTAKHLTAYSFLDLRILTFVRYLGRSPHPPLSRSPFPAGEGSRCAACSWCAKSKFERQITNHKKTSPTFAGDVFPLSDIFAPEQPIKCYVKQAGYGYQEIKIGIGAASLPFGDRLNADIQVPCELALRHIPLQPILSDVAAEWNFQNETSCEDVCRTQESVCGEVFTPLLLASRDGRGFGEQYGTG